MLHDDELARFLDRAVAPDGGTDAEEAAAPDAVRALLAFHRRIAALGRTDDTRDAPLPIVQAAAAIARPGPATATGLGRILARLVFDSRTSTVALRDERSGAGHRLGYAADDLDVDLAVEPLDPAHRRWRLSGQVSGAPSGTAIVAHLHAAAPSAESCAPVDADARGFFVADLPRGRWELELRVGERAILLPDLEME